ncbi:MAG: hypothetical protein ACE5FT_06505 [Candidatus Nanoarchaeia archaeon]
MVTTVKLQEQTKMALDEYKEDTDSYDVVIQKLLLEVRSKDLRKRLVEGYKDMGSDDLALLEEWDVASKEV